MLFYRFSRDFVAQQGFVPPELSGRFDGFFGAVMLVNYCESPVGPYRELLFIPGKFRTPQGRRYSITSIYVDSEASEASGRANWGIPKRTRPFEAGQRGKMERIRVFDENGDTGFDISLRAGGLRFPVTTALIPIHLYQVLGHRAWLVSPRGSGAGQLACVANVWVNPAFFPDISLVKPLLAVKVTGFRMQFPAAENAGPDLPVFSP
jgi:hypothetical protein